MNLRRPTKGLGKASFGRVPVPITKPAAARRAHTDGVGIAFQAAHILFGLQFNLQSVTVRIVEVEGLAISPFDNFGHGDPMVLEPVGRARQIRQTPPPW